MTLSYHLSGCAILWRGRPNVPPSGSIYLADWSSPERINLTPVVAADDSTPLSSIDNTSFACRATGAGRWAGGWHYLGRWWYMYLCLCFMGNSKIFNTDWFSVSQHQLNHYKVRTVLFIATRTSHKMATTMAIFFFVCLSVCQSVPLSLSVSCSASRSPHVNCTCTQDCSRAMIPNTSDISYMINDSRKTRVGSDINKARKQISKMIERYSSMDT